MIDRVWFWLGLAIGLIVPDVYRAGRRAIARRRRLRRDRIHPHRCVVCGRIFADDRGLTWHQTAQHPSVFRLDP